MTIEKFIEKNELSMSVKSADSNPNMSDHEHLTRHFFCTITNGQNSMGLHFSQGSAHTERPTLTDVLDCLASDAGAVENANGFKDWASDLGYDTDSRQAEKTYKVCVKQADMLKALLGDSEYETLLWDIERQ